MKTVITLTSYLLLAAASAWASEEGHHEAHASLLTSWLTFGAYVALLYWLISKKVGAGWQGRRNSIEFAVLKGKDAVEEAKTRLTTVQAALRDADREVEKIGEQYRIETAREIAELKESVVEKIERSKRRAADAAQAEERSAHANIKRELAELAVRRASEQLATGNTAQKDAALRDATLKNLRELVH
ncbi:MAG: ATP synthase F0 subunit B [Oligoflexia bacterium]|nr:ATP synthase F0 subunit B [Oligoflexia bacterium]